VVTTSRLHAPSSQESESLAAAVARGARRARWWVLVGCAVVGAIGISVAWFVPSHRILLMSAAIAVGAFGSGGLADRILVDERTAEDPDQILVAGFAAIRWVSVFAGTCAAVICAGWLFFKMLGASHLSWH
jgi:hypothetical protein